MPAEKLWLHHQEKLDLVIIYQECTACACGQTLTHQMLHGGP